MATSSSLSTSELYPLPSAARLREHFVGKDLLEVDCPAAVIDLAIAKRNCSHMRDAARELGLGLRVHVKTHKTLELTRLQLGTDKHDPARLIVSTVSEAEHLLPLLRELREQGREFNVLYGIPPSSTCIRRLSLLRSELGPNSISFLLDHPSQLVNLNLKNQPHASSSTPIPVFIKCDSGYHRAGLAPQTQEFADLLHAVTKDPNVRLLGFYTHNSHSYAGSSPADALDWLRSEIDCGKAAVERAKTLLPDASSERTFTVSVGATPSATSVLNLAGPSSSSPAPSQANTLREELKHHATAFALELHAGVFSVMDLQQVATRARPSSAATNPSADTPLVSTADIAVTVLAEVLSVYTSRAVPEALVGTGTIALGREPCKSYAGWGVLAASAAAAAGGDGEGNEVVYSEESRTGWVVDRVSQEHGILAWRSGEQGTTAAAATWNDVKRKLQVGDRVRIYPNHACIASAGFGWYLVVDSEGREKGKRGIVDVWVRARGW